MKEDRMDWLNGFEQGRRGIEDNAKLTDMLESPAQKQVKNLVQSLPEDTVSLQWRSALNEKLLTLAPVKAKLSLLVIGFRALAGVGLASLLCIAMISKLGSHPTLDKGPDAEAFASALISEHRQSVASSEIAGPGMVDGEPEKAAQGDVGSAADSDVDSI